MTIRDGIKKDAEFKVQRGYGKFWCPYEGNDPRRPIWMEEYEKALQAIKTQLALEEGLTPDEAQPKPQEQRPALFQRLKDALNAMKPK